MSSIQQAPLERSVAPVRTVLIVDDHHAFADLLAMALDNEPDLVVVGTSDTAAGAVDLAVRTRPSLVVMDIQLGGQDGLEATRRLRCSVPEAVVVVVSAHHDLTWLPKAAAAGAHAYVPKSGSLTELLSILRNANQGPMVVAPSLMLRRPRTDDPAHVSALHLTGRELDVLALVCAGLAPKQIARVLNVSLNTARGHVKAIHSKLGVRSQLEVVAKARSMGLIDRTE
jgi:DNA-binding NarL/FixJ family response regulator